MSRDVPEAAFDPKSHLSEVMWAEGLLNLVEHKKLEDMQRTDLSKLESSVLVIGIDAAERERRAHLAAGYRQAFNKLREHHATHLKLHEEQLKKEEPGAPSKRPPVL